jgi:hypothetical protein
MQQGLAGEEGVDARLGVHALSGPGVVEPGGERHDRGGHREARVAGGEAGRDGVAAAAGVPGERDGRWVFAAFEECAVGVQRVVGPGRERVLWGEPVVQRESPEPGPGHQVRCQRQRGFGRAEHVAAAVKVQDGSWLSIPLRFDEERGAADQLGRCPPHAGRNRECPHERGEALRQPFDRHRSKRLRLFA